MKRCLRSLDSIVKPLVSESFSRLADWTFNQSSD